MLDRAFNPLVVVLLSTIPLIGCGNGSSTGPEDTSSDLGSFEISYEGDASGSISGPAFFNELEIEGPDQTFAAFSVFGVEVEAQEDGFGMARLGGQPEPGTYDIVAATTADPPEGAFGLTIYENTKNLSVESTDGTVTIDRSAADRFQGNFEATLTGFLSGTGVTISATGSFDAVSCTQNVQNCPETLP